MLICNEVLNNYENFKTSLLSNIVGSELAAFTKVFDAQYDVIFRNDFQKEKDATNLEIENFRATYENEYITFTPYPLAQSRPFIFDTLPAPTSTQTTNVKNLYTVKNVDNNNKVYNLKKKFN